jgi:hypothetical protein
MVATLDGGVDGVFESKFMLPCSEEAAADRHNRHSDCNLSLVVDFQPVGLAPRESILFT